MVKRKYWNLAFFPFFLITSSDWKIETLQNHLSFEFLIFNFSSWQSFTIKIKMAADIWQCAMGSARVNQHTHEGWMDNGQETLFCWVPIP
jgi:hypothetical protein